MNTLNVGLEERSRVFLDSSFIIRFLEGDKDAIKLMHLLENASLLTNLIVVSEVWFYILSATYESTYGKYNLKKMKRKLREIKDSLNIFDEFIRRARVKILEINEEIGTI